MAGYSAVTSTFWIKILQEMWAQLSLLWKGKNSSKGLNLNEKWNKPQKVLIIACFEGDDEKA